MKPIQVDASVRCILLEEIVDEAPPYDGPTYTAHLPRVVLLPEIVQTAAPPADGAAHPHTPTPNESNL